ncbi:transposase of ISAar10, IS1380 family [Mycobacterium kansasii 732]|nr:transposase of ISAar10, IS1380 family [Mycobacterium kansasii 732]
MFGTVASDPTVSRLITSLAADAPKALAAIGSARAAARAAAWAAAGQASPGHGIDADHPLIIDLDATLVTAHSEKEKAAPTFKRGFGFHPLCAFVDHGSAGTGSRWRSCCGPAMPALTPPPTTKRSSRARWSNCPFRSAIGSARKFWCAPTPPGPPTNSSTT